MVIITALEDGGLIVKDPDDYLPIEFNLDADMAAAASVTTSVWFVEAVKPSTTDTSMTADTDSFAARATYVRLVGGTLGQLYRLVNRFETNENTLSREDRKIYVLIQ